MGGIAQVIPQTCMEYELICRCIISIDYLIVIRDDFEMSESDLVRRCHLSGNLPGLHGLVVSNCFIKI